MTITSPLPAANTNGDITNKRLSDGEPMLTIGHTYAHLTQVSPFFGGLAHMTAMFPNNHTQKTEVGRRLQQNPGMSVADSSQASLPLQPAHKHVILSLSS